MLGFRFGVLGFRLLHEGSTYLHGVPLQVLNYYVLPASFVFYQVYHRVPWTGFGSLGNTGFKLAACMSCWGGLGW